MYYGTEINALNFGVKGHSDTVQGHGGITHARTVGLLWQPSVIVATFVKYLYVHFLTENKLIMMIM